jgi:hypothetical protein
VIHKLFKARKGQQASKGHTIRAATRFLHLEKLK